jgi:hypothetical protein
VKFTPNLLVSRFRGGHDDVGDQRADDLAERAADHHAHGEVDHVAAHREVTKLFE